MTWGRIAAGHYFSSVSDDGSLHYTIKRIPGGDSYPATVWMLTYPGSRTPDDVFSTLAEAKAAALTHKKGTS